MTLIPERTAETVPILAGPAFVACAYPWCFQPRRFSQVLTIKSTFEITPSGAVQVLPEQPSFVGEEMDPEQPDRVGYPGDLAILKPKADLLFLGHAYPSKTSDTVRLVQLQFGSAVDLRLSVSGDRQWSNSGVTPPRPFAKIPLRPEFAFGGSGYEENPVGRGIAGDALPNVEWADSLVMSPGDRPSAAVLSGIPSSWRERRRHIGTYDASWLEENWPYFPGDASYAYFNCALPHLQVDYPNGDEKFRLLGVHPEHDDVQGRLSGLRPRAFAQPLEEPEESIEIPLQIDTVVFDLDALQVSLIWRGSIAVRDEFASALASYLVCEDRLDRPQTQRQLDAQCWRLLKEATQSTSPRPTPAASTVEEPAIDPRTVPKVRGLTPRMAQKLGLPAAAALAGKSSEDPFDDLLTQAVIDEDGLDALTAEFGVSDESGETDTAMFGAFGEIAAQESETQTADGSHDEDASATRLLDNDEDSPDDATRTLDRQDDDAATRDVDMALIAADSSVISKGRIHSLLASGESLAGANLSHADLRGLDFSNADLSGADLSHARLAGTCFRGARLTGAVLFQVDASDVDFHSATLHGADFTSATLENANFEGATLTDAAFVAACLSGARFERSAGAGPSFVEARLRGASFDSALISDADFSHADLAQTSFKKAKLDDVRFYRASGPVDATEASMSKARASEAQFARSKFDGCAATDSTWSESDLSESTFVGAHFVRVSFTASNLSGSSLREAVLKNSEFRLCNFERSSLVEADLYQAILHAAKFESSDLRGANLYQADTRDANFRGALLEGANLAGSTMVALPRTAQR